MGTPWPSRMRMMRWVRAAVRSCNRPGSAGESHSSRPSGSVTTCAFTPCPAVLVGVVGPSVTDPVAPGERAVQQNEVGVVFA